MTDIITGTRGCIFDCDGTLLDTMPAWNRAENHMQELAGRPFTEEEFTMVRSAPMESLGDIFHNHFGIGESPEAVTHMIDDMLLGEYLNAADPKPGVPELLAKLAEAHIPCTVVTSSPRRYVEPGLRRAGLLDYFCKLCTTDECACSKSDAKIWETALAAMGSTPQTTWAFDDAIYAVRTAAALGIQTVGIFDCEETAGDWETLQAAATTAVHSLEELL